MKRVLMPVGILLGCILLAVVLVRNPTVVEETSPEIIPVTVRVAEVQTESVQLVVESQGKVQAAQLLSLSAPVAGPVAFEPKLAHQGAARKMGVNLLGHRASVDARAHR